MSEIKPHIATSQLERIAAKNGFSQHLRRCGRIESEHFFKIGNAYHLQINATTATQIVAELRHLKVESTQISLVETTIYELLGDTQAAMLETETRPTAPTEKPSDETEASTKPTYSDTFTEQVAADGKPVNTDQNTLANDKQTTQISDFVVQLAQLKEELEQQKHDIQTIQLDSTPNEEREQEVTEEPPKWSSNTYRKATIAVCLAITVVSTFMVFLHNGFNAYSFFFALFFNLLFVMITLISIASMQEKSQSTEQMMIAKTVSAVFALAEIYMHYRCFSASLDAEVIGSVWAFSAFMSFIIAGANLSALLGLRNQTDNDNKVA